MLRRHLSGGLTAAAALLVFAALVVPDQVARLKTGQSLPAAFLRLPLEGILGAAVLLAAPARWRRAVAVPLGLDRIAGWGWQVGLAPRPDAPVWPMDAFRDRFLTAYAAPGRPDH